MNILIVKTSAIGDVTHTLPALNALRRHYPDASITWLVEEAASDIVLGHKALDRVLVSKRKSWVKMLRNGPRLAALGEIVDFTKKLRDTKYDLIIDFQGLLKSGILVGLARGKRKVGFGRGMEHSECSYIFLNERIPPVDMNIHALERELMLLEAIGIDCSERVFDFPIETEHSLRVREMLTGQGVEKDRPLVAINPMTKWQTKLWDNAKFPQLADELVAKGCAVVFTGGPDDRPVIETIIAAMANKAVNVAGSTSLKELAALYEMADLVITTDTGPMHIAAAVQTPVVAIFGPTAPWRTGPFGEGHQVIRTGIECSPCLKRKCDTIACMKQISMEQVLDAACKVIDRG